MKSFNAFINNISLLPSLALSYFHGANGVPYRLTICTIKLD